MTSFLTVWKLGLVVVSYDGSLVPCHFNRLTVAAVWVGGWVLSGVGSCVCVGGVGGFLLSVAFLVVCFQFLSAPRFV